MAGDWIKIRPSLLTSPKVNGIAKALEGSRNASRSLSTGFNGPMGEVVTRNALRYVTLASLVTVWGAANEHTRDGVFRNADLQDVDDISGVPGFGEAMASVGWAVYDADSETVTLPNFEEWNTCGASRAKSSAAERQRRYRERKAREAERRDVTDGSSRDVTSDVTSDAREEKRREEDNPPVSPQTKKSNRGCRIPDECPTDDDLLWATENFPAVDHNLEAAKFRDYWTAKTGSSATKKDWSATWRNWIRRAAERQGSKGDPKLAERVAEIYREELVPPLLNVIDITPPRQSAIADLAARHLPNEAKWRQLFRCVAESSVLTGRKPWAGGEARAVDFDFVLKHAVTIMEGKYDD